MTTHRGVSAACLALLAALGLFSPAFASPEEQAKVPPHPPELLARELPPARPIVPAVGGHPAPAPLPADPGLIPAQPPPAAAPAPELPVPGASPDEKAPGPRAAESLDRLAIDQSRTDSVIDGRSPLNRSVRAVLAAGQRLFYGRVARVSVAGAWNAPKSGAYVIVANHNSHLDMGLVKHALGGRELAALAAKDYFYSSPLRRFFFSRFTNLVPFDRRGGLKESLLAAGRALAQGRPLLIFPEGTRSSDGAMGKFKDAAAHIALKNGVGVLPVYLDGTRAALPKGALIPRRRALKAVIGTLITAEELAKLAQDAPKGAANRAVTERLEAAVRELGACPPRPLALVTGASSGIGRALALRLARAGYDLALVARDQSRLGEVAAEAGRLGAQAVSIPLDLSVAGAAARAVRTLGGRPVEVLVNNAGFGLHGDFSGADGAAEAAMVRAHVGAALDLTKEVLPGMRARGSGRILNVGSLYSYLPAPRQAVYGATKAFLLSFSKSLAAELDGSGVTVTALLPGITRTEFRERAGIATKRLSGMAPERVAEAGYRAMAEGRRVVVPGLGNKIILVLAALLPAAAVAALMRAVNRFRGLSSAPAAR